MQLSLKPSSHYYIAILVGLLVHATLSLFTFETTYDAFVHLFFADHYASDWFATWDDRWYTGFTVTSYPPLVHQALALLSFAFGLKGAFTIWSAIVIILLIRGVYKFSLLWVHETAALYASILAVLSTSVAEALHVFGQLPSLTGCALLLNACPEVYKWFRSRQGSRLIIALLFIAVISSAHHVTTIFGMVFFILPVLGLAVYDETSARLGKGQKVTIMAFSKEAIKQAPRLIFFGISVILITLIVIFPYWYWSKSDPIAQIAIPHGSRDSFITNLSSGLVFFLIPWSVMLFFLPFLFHSLFRKRNLFLGLSAALLFILGTGGTTPIPRLLLGSNAFDILTLDRFTFWATLIALPFWGLFFYELLHGSWRRFLIARTSALVYMTVVTSFVGLTILSFLLTVNITFFRDIQPAKIDIDPIVNFLEKDKHEEWRYLTLGFGDQMAWLSANTRALTVDGNYHSVRRLPEMTTRAVERLENAKYQREEGLSALREFVTNPERYHLKFIFSNDRFYDPMLYYNGWRYLQQLDNGIVIWERPDVLPLPAVLPRKSIPAIQSLMWGILPLACLLLLVICSLILRARNRSRPNMAEESLPEITTAQRQDGLWSFQLVYLILFAGFLAIMLLRWSGTSNEHKSPENIITAYYANLDFKRFEQAYDCLDPITRQSRELFLLKHSLKGGLLSSYAKMDSMAIDIKFLEDRAIADVNIRWITSVMKYSTQQRHQLNRIGNRWYISPTGVDVSEPPSTFIRQPSVNFMNHGRRKATLGTTGRRDELDRPEISVSEVKLLKRDGSIHVIGMMDNIDQDPAHLSLLAKLYDAQGKILLEANSLDIIQYRLLPGEKSPFRIDFEEAARSQSISMDNLDVASSVLFFRTTVSDEPVYRSTGVNFQTDAPPLDARAELYNYGTEEIIIPGILNTYRDKDELYWVDRIYLPFSVRPARKQAFSLPPDGIRASVVISEHPVTIVINGAISESVKMTGRTPIDWQRETYIQTFTKSAYQD